MQNERWSFEDFNAFNRHPELRNMEDIDHLRAVALDLHEKKALKDPKRFTEYFATTQKLLDGYFDHLREHGDEVPYTVDRALFTSDFRQFFEKCLDLQDYRLNICSETAHTYTIKLWKCPRLPPLLKYRFFFVKKREGKAAK